MCICLEDKCVFVLRTNAYLSWGQMRICLEDKCVFVLRTNVYSHCFSQIPLFVGVLPRFGEWPWQMGSSQPLSLQYVLSPKQRKLRHTKAGCFREISELGNYMMEGTVGTGQNLLVLESSFLAPNPVCIAEPKFWMIRKETNDTNGKRDKKWQVALVKLDPCCELISRQVEKRSAGWYSFKYRLVFGGTGSVEGTTCWYLEELGQY